MYHTETAENNTSGKHNSKQQQTKIEKQYNYYSGNMQTQNAPSSTNTYCAATDTGFVFT